VAVGKPLHLRLFLEGEEVPVISAHVSVSINAPAAASIQVIPLDEATYLHPRTMVHLFYLDSWVGGSEYRILFSGEVLGFSYQQTPQSRGLVLQCVDFSSYWDAARVGALEYGDSNSAFTDKSAYYGANISLIDNLMSHDAQQIVNLLKEQPLTPGLETVSGLAGGIVRIMEAVSGIPGVAKGINDFFTVAELRCKLLEQITAEENDDTAYHLLDAGVFDQWLRQGIQNAGVQITFRDLIKLLFQYIYYEMVPNPTAKFVDEDVTKSSAQRLHSQIIRPDCWFAPPPVCNVIFPEQYSQYNYDRSFATEVTRNLVQLFSTIIDPGQQNELTADRVLAPNLAQVAGKVNEVDPSLSNRMLMPHEYHTGIIIREEALTDVSSIPTGDSNADEKVKLRAERIDWTKKIALFHFFKFRFASRNLSLGGRFNPQVVCGFPAVVIRSPFFPNRNLTGLGDTAQQRMETVINNPETFGAPQHLLGMVGNVSHSVDQSGGVTSIGMGHVRQHMGTDDSYLKILGQIGEPYIERSVHVILDFDELTKNEAALTTGSSEQNKITDILNSISSGASDQATLSSIVEGPAALKQNSKLLDLLAGVTPQKMSKRDISYGVYASTQMVFASSPTTEVDPSSGSVTTESSVRSTVMKEEKKPSNPSPPGTTWASFRSRGQSTIALAPSGEVKVSPGDTGVMGKIGAIQVLDADVRYSGDRVFFKKVLLHESVEVPLNQSLPVEELIRPRAWFSAKYGNLLIGEQIYQPFFGCNSIIDDLRLKDGKLTLSQDVSSAVDQVVVVSNPENPPGEVNAISTAEAKKLLYTIEKAVNTIAYLYGKVKSRGLDVDEFIRQYTRRDIASLTDILGSPQLVFDVKGTKAVKNASAGGRVGFFTTAVHHQLVKQGSLVGLLESPTTGMKRVAGDGAETPVDPVYDVRKEKKDRVMAYQVALTRGPAFKG
jgi:hypothetical protein